MAVAAVFFPSAAMPIDSCGGVAKEAKPCNWSRLPDNVASMSVTQLIDHVAPLYPDRKSGAQDGKECLIICERWERDCISNPRTGSRKCRKVCKSLTRECVEAETEQSL